MKNIKTILLLSLFIMMFKHESKAQAFEGKGSRTLSLTIGAAEYFHFGGYYGTFGARPWNFYTPAIAVNVNVEFGVHKYVGIAPNFGVAASIYGGGVIGIHIPIGVQGNFHFYQLIDDKASKDLHSDKLDIYGGINMGGGPDIVLGSFGGTNVGGFFYVGPQVGVRYYPKSNVGITAEVGYGRTLANFGVCFKL